MKAAEFEQMLRRFCRLLQQENKYLISNQPDKLMPLVEEKQKYVRPFQEYPGQVTVRMKGLIQQIQALQQENLLLTKQAMGFEEMMLKSIRSNLKTPGTIYSPDKSKKAADSLSLIDWEA
ncbi:MAG: hypothetical protein ABF539_09820 [Liquorilactobacillus nagelii]|jgi:hypothetical protein|uniref:hypothetical protein n=1 Tax=Liquorilactobacillus nagelii TaxID=82688 RepID=UPI0039E8C956